METLRKCLFRIRILFKAKRKSQNTRNGLCLQTVMTIRKKKMKIMQIWRVKKVFDGTSM